MRPFSVEEAAARLRISEAQVTALANQGSLVGFRDDADRLVVLLPVPAERQSELSDPWSDGAGSAAPLPEAAPAAGQTAAEVPVPSETCCPTAEPASQWRLLKEAFDTHCRLVQALVEQLAGARHLSDAGVSQSAGRSQSDCLQASRPPQDRQHDRRQPDGPALDEVYRRLDSLERGYALQERDLDKLLEVTQLIRDHLETATVRRGKRG